MVLIEQIRALLRVLNHPLNKKRKFKTLLNILWWKINQRFFHLPALVEINNGVKCICYPTSSYGGLIVYTKLPEYPEMVLMKKRLKQKGIFFDVGANMGAFTMLAASLITKGKVYAFEPIPSVLKILYQNVNLNQLQDRVKIIEKVVSNNNGKEKFIIQDVAEYSHISYSDTYKDVAKGISIPSIRLEDYCKGEKINFIDMMKIDVEGAEMKVLEGIEPYISKGQIGLFIIELCAHSHMYGNNHQQVLDYLRKFGYLTFMMDNKLRLKEIKQIKKVDTYNIVAFLKKDLSDIKKSLRTN